MLTASVIIATYNGARKIPNLLEGLRNQTFADFEVIVVVDGSTDDTVDVLRAFVGRFRSLRIIEQANAGRSLVRNRGANAATGDLLVFYDDDMVPSAQSVERHIRLHSEGPDKLVSGNPIELVQSGKTDIQNYKATRTEHWIKKYSETLTLMTADNLFFSAANSSIKKTVFEALNGFDERLTDAEDYDLAIRALQARIPVFFDKQNTAVHLDFITARSYVHRLRQYVRAHQHLSVISPGNVSVSNPTHGIKQIIYRMFASPVWIRLIDSERFLFIPRVVRYKLYDLILHSLSTVHPDVVV